MHNTLNLNNAPEPPQPQQLRKKRRTFAIVILVILAVIALWYVAFGDTAWKAVFLSNNQVYFGHFRYWPFASTITLKDVYYLQITQPSQQLSGEDQSQLKLVKLGSEIHGPTSEMVIPLSQIMFWETLRNDSAIVKTIQGISANQ